MCYLPVAALLLWMLIDGPLRTGLHLESIRLPALVAVATMAVRSVASFDYDDRETFLNGLIVLGFAQGAIALVQLAGTVQESPLALFSERASATIGSPNALGILLVSTSCLTARALENRRSTKLSLALMIQMAAVISTGSRTAIALALVIMVAFAARGRSSRVWLAFAIAAAILGLVVLARRFASDPVDDRPQLWWGALKRIADHPLAGELSDGAIYATANEFSRPTTHAHNEILQFTVDYGLIGFALGFAVLYFGLRGRVRNPTNEKWVVAATVSLCISGMFDFTLRITAIAIIAATLGAVATTEPSRTAVDRLL
jgi:O-antigen ligase